MRRGIPFAVSLEAVQRAAKLLAAAARRRGDQHAGVAAELGVERGVLQLELADGVEAQLRVLAVVRAGVGVRRAVEHRRCSCSARRPLTMKPSVLLNARRNPVSLVATPGSVLSSEVKSRPFRLSSRICVSEIV